MLFMQFDNDWRAFRNVQCCSDICTAAFALLLLQVLHTKVRAPNTRATAGNQHVTQDTALTVVLGSTGGTFTAELAVTASELEPDVT